MAEKSQPHRRGRILFSILGLLLGVGVLPLVWTSNRLVSKSREDLQVSLKETQIAKAKTLASQAELYVSSAHLQIVTIARTLEVDAGRMPFADRLKRIREQNALVPYLGNDQARRLLVYLSVVDTEGVGAQSGLALQDQKLVEQLQEGFQRGQNGTPMISVPVVANSLQEPVIILGEPVKLAGRVLGVVLGVVSLQPIREMTTASSGASEVYVVDNRGRIVAHSDPSQPLAADFSKVPIVEEFMTGRQRAGGTVNFMLDERPMVGTFIPLTDKSGWGVVVQTDEDTAYQTAIALRRDSFRTVAIVTALAVVLGSLFAGEISRPVQKLAEGARRLAGGDYSTRVSVRSHNEVGVLADAFNVMGEEIQKAIEEVKRRAEENEELFMGS
ncbi:MAG TPA: HAMP domain-containing protein, partial [Vicinamibacteria bacterium]